ncbi:MAG: hypothetical protein JHC33_01120 [Ignisphaera sp.]|jgi:predicted transcriptional regulator|nr:hypothetical protein [Ignisphaera sp.]
MTELTTRQAVEYLLREGYSKYRISKFLGVQPIMVQHYLRGGTRMSTATAHKMEQLFNIFITDTYQKKQPDETL